MVENPRKVPSLASIVPGMNSWRINHGPIDPQADARLEQFRAQRLARQKAAREHHLYDPRHFTGGRGEVLAGGLFPHTKAAHIGGVSTIRARMADTVMAAGRFGRTAGSIIPGVGIGALIHTPILQQVLGGALSAANGINHLERAAQEQRDVAAGIQEGRIFGTREQVLTEAGKREAPAWLKRVLGERAQGVTGMVSRTSTFFSEAHRQAKTAERLNEGIDRLLTGDKELEGFPDSANRYIANANDLLMVLDRYVSYGGHPEQLRLSKEGQALVAGRAGVEEEMVAGRALVEIEARLRFFERDENAGDFTFTQLQDLDRKYSVEETYKLLREFMGVFPGEMGEKFEHLVQSRIRQLAEARKKLRKGMRYDRLAHGVGSTAVSLVGIGIGIEAVKVVAPYIQEGARVVGNTVEHAWSDVAEFAHAAQEDVVSGVRAVRQAFVTVGDAVKDGFNARAQSMDIGGTRHVADAMRGVVSPSSGEFSQTVGRTMQPARSLGENLSAGHPLEALPQHAHTGVPLNADNATWDQSFGPQHDLFIHNGVISFDATDPRVASDPLIQSITRASGGTFPTKDMVIFAKVNGKWEMFPMSDAKSLHFPAGTEVSTGFVTGPNDQALAWSQIADGQVPPGGHVVRLATSHMPAGVSGGSASSVPASQPPQIPLHDGSRVPGARVDTTQSTVNGPSQPVAPSTSSGGNGLEDFWDKLTPDEQHIVEFGTAAPILAGSAIWGAGALAEGIQKRWQSGHASSQEEDTFAPTEAASQDPFAPDGPFATEGPRAPMIEPVRPQFESRNLADERDAMQHELAQRKGKLDEIEDALFRYLSENSYDSFLHLRSAMRGVPRLQGKTNVREIERELDRYRDILPFQEALTTFVGEPVQQWAPFLLLIPEDMRTAFLEFCPPHYAAQVEEAMNAFSELYPVSAMSLLTNDVLEGVVNHLQENVDEATLKKVFGSLDIASQRIIMQLLYSSEEQSA